MARVAFVSVFSSLLHILNGAVLVNGRTQPTEKKEAGSYCSQSLLSLLLLISQLVGWWEEPSRGFPSLFLPNHVKPLISNLPRVLSVANDICHT